MLVTVAPLAEWAGASWGVKRYLVPVQRFFVVPQSSHTRLIPIMKSNIKRGNIARRVFQYRNAV